jgi:hypothetical protein
MCGSVDNFSMIDFLGRHFQNKNIHNKKKEVFQAAYRLFIYKKKQNVSISKKWWTEIGVYKLKSGRKLNIIKTYFKFIVLGI